MASEDEHPVEFSIIRTTDVNALVTICQDRTPPGSRSPTPTINSWNHCIEPLASIPTRVEKNPRTESPSWCKVSPRDNFATDRQRAGLSNFAASEGLVLRQSRRARM